jgi:hypothetical protein
MEWAEPKVRKEDYVRPAQLRMKRANRHGVYFILKSMEQGQTFRSTVPRFPTEDPNYRILARQRSRFTHYYFYIEDEVLGPMSMRVASFFPFQATYYLNGHNFIERELNRDVPQKRQRLSGGIRLYKGLPTASHAPPSGSVLTTGRCGSDPASPDANGRP